MSVDVVPFPLDDPDMPPEVREVQERVTALVKATREQHGDRFTDTVQLLYSIAQLRLFIHGAPREFAEIGNALVTQVAQQLDKMLGLSGEQVEAAGYIAQQMVDMCLIRRGDPDDEPKVH